MNLFLHIGTEKTGSSYLQSLAAVNRSLLQKQKIWFPEAGKREKHLLQGKVSPGNGGPLYLFLDNGDFDEIGFWVNRQLKQAEKKSCESLLISNELLILAFGKQSVLHHFLQRVYDLGILSVKFLLVLRDPVDQCLSLFKHRAKNGTTPEFQEWIHKHYVYGDKLFEFLAIAQNDGIDLTCRKYHHGSGHLEKIFFREWLQTNSFLENAHWRVNPSLTLSELVLLKELRKKDRYLAKAYYERMIMLPKREKAPDHFLESAYRKWLINYLVKYNATWRACNQCLSIEEQLEIPERASRPIFLEKPEKLLSFSEKQTSALAELMADCQKPGVRLRLGLEKWRHSLVKVKNRMLTQ